jgi:hypothetical protein
MGRGAGFRSEVGKGQGRLVGVDRALHLHDRVRVRILDPVAAQLDLEEAPESPLVPAQEGQGLEAELPLAARARARMIDPPEEGGELRRGVFEVRPAAHEEIASPGSPVRKYPAQ